MTIVPNLQPSKRNKRKTKKYHNNPLRGTLVRDLDHEKSGDLDPKKPKRNIKVNINRIRDVAEARALIPIVPDQINVNVLKIERKGNSIEVETEEDTSPGIIEIEISI